MLNWALFAVITAAVFYGGSRLSRYGDILAEKTGLGRMWIGMVLMATATSLPELITGLSSVLVFDTPDIAVGNVLGACAINFLIIAALDLLERAPISGRVHEGHQLSAAFVIVLASIVLAGIFTGPMSGAIGWIGPYSIAIFLIYLAAMRLIYRYERRRLASFTKELAEELKYGKVTTAQAVRGFAVNSAIVLVSALWLPYMGERIASSSSLGEGFVGSVFIAFSTTLPELVVSVTAMRIGASDMAVGNLLGSNLFNLSIIALDDFFYTKGPMLGFVSAGHVLTALTLILMSGVLIIGLSYRVAKKTLPLSWDSILLVLIYVLYILTLYSAK
jgi:cation:H+ antiporter